MSSANLTNHFTFWNVVNDWNVIQWLRKCSFLLFPVANWVLGICDCSFTDKIIHVRMTSCRIWSGNLWHAAYLTHVHWPMFSLFHCQGMFCSVKHRIGNPFWVIFPGQTLHKCVCLCAFAITRWSLDCFLLFFFFFWSCVFFPHSQHVYVWPYGLKWFECVYSMYSGVPLEESTQV